MKKLFIALIAMMIMVLVGCTKPIEPPITSIAITGEIQVEVGNTIRLNVNTTQPVNWITDDPSIAIVSNGLVTGVAQGVVEITVELQDNPMVFDSVEIAVIPSANGNDLEYFQYYKTKILSIDANDREIELLNCPTNKLANDVKIYHLREDMLFNIDLNDLYIGLENVYAQVDTRTNEITDILVDGAIGFSNIRVAIRREISNIADDTTIYHDNIDLQLFGKTTLQTYDGVSKFILAKDSVVNITYFNRLIRVSVDGNIILDTNKRIIFNPDDSSIRINSIRRGSGAGFAPTYEGNIEISIAYSRLLIVNDVNLENYLTKVVPSEMPASYHIEALKSQAIAARTYAYMDILNKNRDIYGYTVDDSISSQVYNNQSTNIQTTNAVNETQGIIMMYDGTPVQAFYYSTSSGLTASAHEVWIQTGVTEPIPYLIGQNLTYDNDQNPIPFDYTDEDSMLDFFKLIRVNTPDFGTTHHRWRVSMTPDQLRITVNTNLRITYNNAPQSVLTKVGDNWVSQEIPASIGTITDVYVEERGTSGVVVSLIIETSSGIYKIINQYNIRFTIRPMNAGSTVVRQAATNMNTTYTRTFNNDSILLSGFFAIARENGNYVFYGGGNGHGVGMSQNGANGFANALGYTYDQILTTYYSNIELTDITYSYDARDDISEVFDFMHHLG